jgi:UDP-GlcNAc:undecaprenyl-phosphate GlcNAc-1-phosphate transferase
MKYLLVFMVSLIGSLTVTPVAIRLARKLGIVDRPADGRWARKTTPRMGGVAIFAGFILALAVLLPFQRNASLFPVELIRLETMVVLLGGFTIFTLGLLDDKFGTIPVVKFLVQLGVATALVLSGIRLKILPAVVAIPLSLVWIVMITNAFNLIDNMDGLSPGVAFIASMAFFLLSWVSGHGQAIVPVLALALAGACLGFLPYNFNPAVIFMGDCGSLFLGYILSVLAILGYWQRTSPIFLVLTAPVLVLGYAVFDTTLVTVLRLKAGGRPWIGGKDHSSHRLVMLGLSEKKAVLLLYAFGILGSVSAFILLSASLAIGIPLLIFLCMAAATLGWILANVST